MVSFSFCSLSFSSSIRYESKMSLFPVIRLVALPKDVRTVRAPCRRMQMQFDTKLLPWRGLVT